MTSPEPPGLQEALASALRERYTLTSELGRGGMAVVFRAHDRKYDRDVAIKVMRPEIAAAVGPARFLREIRIAAGLTHPHILPLYEAGEADGLLYYTMPFIVGENLRDRLRRERQLPIDEALQIVRETGSALNHAHAMGIVHRDIKPENILLVSGHAVVADFGIARAVHAATDEALTETGLAIGTPLYMSPEQGAAETDIDGRADQYALACVLYEMLAGDPPFTGTSAHVIIARHSATPVPPLRPVRATVSRVLEAAIERALAKVPADRFATVQAFLQALDATAEPGARPRMRWSGRRARMFGGAIAAAAAAVALWMLAPWSAPAGPAAAEPLVAVLPFDLVGPRDLDWLEDDLPELLSLEFTGVGGPRAMDRHQVVARWRASDPEAETSARYRTLAGDLGVSHVLTGRIVSEPAGIRTLAVLLDPASGDTLATSTALGTPTDFVALAESLAVGLLVDRAGQASRLAGVLSSRPLAVRAWLDGLERFRRGDMNGAADRYREAVDADTTFALAAAGLMWSAAWAAGLDQDYRRGRRLAFAHRDRLPRPDSMLLVAESYRNAYPEWMGGELENYRRYAELVRAFPDRWDMWARYGDFLWHEGSGYVEDGRRLAVEAFRRAVSMDSLASIEPWWHLAEYAVLTSDQDAYRSTPPEATTRWQDWLMAVVAGNEHYLDSVGPAMSDWQTWELVIPLSVLLQRGDDPQFLERLVPLLQERAPTDQGARIALFGMHLNRGQPAAALTYRPDDDRTVLWLALHSGGDSALVHDARRPIEERINQQPAVDAERARTEDLCHLAHAALAAGDTSWTAGVLDGMRALRPDAWYVEVCGYVLEAWHAVLTGGSDPRVLVARADSVLMIGGNNDWHQAGWRITVAALYEAVDQPEAALRRIRMWPGAHWDFGLNTRLLMVGRLAARLGRTEEAIEAYRHYLTLMSDAEPARQSEVAQVRAELARLAAR